ncbi:XrtA/PEP-CTERM system TPR-repeat protein PrsT [Massilia sp. TWP1-3-3]|uniref:XrtA/PEP-CTERM system TPR-repeat protein PrsT n=1 Tax=Massilia sp. TWP1-3-3 TaxID=2804573 RepID=UPI003CEA2F48
MSGHKQPLWSRSVAAALAVSLGITIAGCRGSDPDTMIAEARQFRDKGDLRAAVIQLKNVIQHDADNRSARLLLGELYLDQGDAESAEKELRLALALGADSGTVALLLGKSLLMQGQYDRILSDIAPDAAPTQRPATLALRASALLGLGKVEPARALFDEALKLHADAPEALLGLARIAMWQKQPDTALALLKRALAASPGDIECLRFQADLLRADGKADEALAIQHKILERRPNNAQALIDVANLQTDAGRFAEARTALAAARKVAGSSLPLMYSEAVLNYRENKLPAALESVQRLLRAAPEHYPTILLAGAVQSALGAHQQAEQHLQKFLHAYPGHPYATKLLVSLHISADHPEAALALLGPLLEADDADVELLALAGEANLRARHFSAAASLFDKASALRPEAPALHAALALSRMGDGDNARALAELERAASLERSPARTGVLLVITYLRANMPDKALATVLDMEKHGNNPLIQNLKGGIYLARNDLRSARASFMAALGLDAAYLPALTNLEQLDVLEHKTVETRKRYLAALTASPGNSAVMEALSALAAAHNNVPEAIGWMERATAEHPDALPLALRAGTLYVRAGDKQKALVFAQKLQSGHPASAEALALLGQAYAANGQYGPAADTYVRLAALTPAAGTPHLHMASVLIAQKQDAAAVAALNKALALEPDLLEARITLINLLSRNSRFGEALALAVAFQKRHPDGAAGFKLEGDVYAAQGKHASAYKAYEKAFGLAPGGALLIQMYGTLVKQGRVAEADASVIGWLRRHPGDVPTRLYYASSKLVGDDPKTAIAQLELVLKHAPDNLAALNDLAWSYQRTGERKGLALAQRAHALAPDNPAVMDTLGWIYLEQGELARALPLLQKAAALAPNAAEIRYHYGLLLAKTGDKRGARRELEKALASTAHFAKRAEAKSLLSTL